jgi:hypothetical protein
LTTSTDIEPIRPDIDSALGLLAVNGGNLAQTARQTSRAPATLRDWRESHPARYREHCERIAQAVERDIVIGARNLAQSVGETERLALERTHEQLEANQAKDPSGVLLRLATTKGIQLTKLLELTGRPTQIVEHRDASELMRAIRSRVTVLEGEATEITD